MPRVVVPAGRARTVPRMTMELSDRSRLARRLGSVLEPVVGQVYFSPECHAGYVALGFAPSPGDANGVALPDGPSYFASRGSVMGQVPGEVIAAAFGVFSPEVVVPLVDDGLDSAPTPRRSATPEPRVPSASCAGCSATHPTASIGPPNCSPPGLGAAADRRPSAGRRHPLARRPDRPARRGLAPRRLPARVPRRFPQRGVGLGGLHTPPRSGC